MWKNPDLRSAYVYAYPHGSLPNFATSKRRSKRGSKAYKRCTLQAWSCKVEHIIREFVSQNVFDFANAIALDFRTQGVVYLLIPSDHKTIWPASASSLMESDKTNPTETSMTSSVMVQQLFWEASGISQRLKLFESKHRPKQQSINNQSIINQKSISKP